MIGRYLPANDYLAVKATTRELIDACGGPVKAATYTRVGHQDLSRYGSVHDDHVERFMPADVIADLESQCKTPLLSREMARLADHMLVALPIGHATGALGRITAATLKETSDVFVAIGIAMADDKVSDADADRIEREIDGAMTMLATLRLQVRKEAEKLP